MDIAIFLLNVERRFRENGQFPEVDTCSPFGIIGKARSDI
jgi:hypothetical protein